MPEQEQKQFQSLAVIENSFYDPPCSLKHPEMHVCIIMSALSSMSLKAGRSPVQLQHDPGR